MNRVVFRVFLALALAVFALSGCVKTRFFPAEGAERYPPTKEIRVLRSSPPEDSYEILGIVTAEGPDENKLLAQLKKKAMLVGADGVIIRATRDLSSTYASERRTEFTKYKFRLEAIAIKFKKKN